MIEEGKWNIITITGKTSNNWYILLLIDPI